MNPLTLLNLLEVFSYIAFIASVVLVFWIAFVNDTGWNAMASAFTVVAVGFLALGAFMTNHTSRLFYLEPNTLAVRFIPNADEGETQYISVSQSGLQDKGWFDVIYTYDATRQSLSFSQSVVDPQSPLSAINVRDQYNFNIGFDVSVEWEIIPELTMRVFETRGPGMGSASQENSITGHVVLAVRSITRQSFAELGISTDDFRSEDLLSPSELEELGVDAASNSGSGEQSGALERVSQHWFVRLNEALEGNASEYIACINAAGGNEQPCVYTGAGVRVTAVYVRNPSLNDQWEALVERANNARLETQAALEESERNLTMERGNTAVLLEQRSRSSQEAQIENRITIDRATAQAEAELIIARARAEAITLEIEAYGDPQLFVYAEMVRTLNPRIQLWILDSETVPILPFTSNGSPYMIPLTGDSAGDILPISEDDSLVPLPPAEAPLPEATPGG